VLRGQYFCNTGELLEQIRYNIGYRKSKCNESTVKTVMKYLRDSQRITTMKKPRGFLVTVLNYSKYQNLKNYEKTDEGTHERTRAKPELNSTSPSINKNDKNDKNYKNDQLGEEVKRDILKHLGREALEIDNPAAYLSKIERTCMPVAIERAWKDWKRGVGIESPAEFFTRCKHYTGK